MKSTSHRILSVVLSLLLLVASNSYAISSHFCGETLVSVSYLGADLGCEMENQNDNCTTKATKKGCCSDRNQVIESNISDYSVKASLEFQVITFVVFFVDSYINSYAQPELEKEFFKDFSPPDIPQDIQVLHQTFLI